MNKVDGAVDKQYDFIKEMKGIKNYLWELKATMQESTERATIAPPVIETIAEQPIVPTVVEEEKLDPTVVEEKLAPAAMEEVIEKTAEETVERVAEDPIINPQIVEEVTAEETTIAPQPIEANQPYHSRKPDFEKQVDDWFKPKKSINWERFIGENLFSKIGIGIIIIGVFIGVKYSIEHNLISPAMRLVLGYLVGAGLFVAGAMLKKKYKSFSAVLVSGAMTIFYFVTFIGYSVFNFFPQSLTFILMFLFTAFTVAASLNYNKVVIALIGLVGSYAVPFLLSDNSGRVSILFAYTAIINIGVLIISFYKQWRSLYLSAFVFTWLMLLSLSGNAYKYEDFTPYFIFNLVTFLTFYIAFIFQKIHQEKELKEIDVVLFLSNSLLFFGMGVWYIYDHYTMENRTIMAMFTLVNALLHFGVAYYFHVKKFPSQGLKYLILVLALSYATLVIPIQFKGSWITVFWSAEAALLFWFGRRKNLLVYERISYAVMLLATFSLIIDWTKADYSLYYTNLNEFSNIVPFGNALFINALLYSAAFGFMAYTHHLTQLANKEIYKLLSIILNILCVASLYFIFFREITILCDVRVLQQTPNLTNNYVAWEALNNFKTIWRTVYSLLFVTIYTLLNIRVFKSKQLGEIQFGISTLLTFIFMTLGLYTFSELRESYLDNPQLSLWFLNVRYVGIVVFAIFCYTSYLLSRFLNLKEEMQKSLEFVLHLIILWVASSELLHWTELYRSASNYKLGLTILWGSYALFLVVLGIFKRKKHLRISGIVLIGFSILKLFLYDTTHLDALRKTIVFVILGFLVLVASFFYNKYTNKIEETDKSENNETTDNNVTN